MNLIINIVTTLITVIIMYKYFQYDLSSNQVNKKKLIYLLLASEFICLFSNFIDSYTKNQVLLFVFDLIGTILILMIFDTSIKYKILSAVKYYFISLIVFFSAFCVQIITLALFFDNYFDRAEDALSFLEKDYFYDSTIFGYYSLIIIFLVYAFIKRKKYVAEYEYSTLLLLNMFISSCLIMYIVCIKFIYPESREIEMYMHASSCSLIFINFVLLLIDDFWVQHVRKIKNIEVGIKQNELLISNGKAIEKFNIEQKAYENKIVSTSNLIMELADKGNNEEIIKIIDIFLDDKCEENDEILCRDSIVNALLTDKIEAAKKSSIDIELNIEPYVDFSKIDDADKISILSNILDNAIEASKKLENQDKKTICVDVFTTQNGKFNVIKIENYFDGTLKKNGDKLTTTKDNQHLHGFGIEIIENILSKYKGFYEKVIEGNKFTSIVVLSAV